MLVAPIPPNDQPCVPSLPEASPGVLVLKEPIPEELIALGREVLELVPRKQGASLEVYRRAADDLSQVLKTTGVRMKPKVLYYLALRVKWAMDSVRE
jgi:hypothetical protein